MIVNIKKLHPDAVIPKYANPGDAGLDLVACDIVSESATHITYDVGLAMEIPEGYVGFIYPRSSIRKYEISLSNSVGVIDSGYRGTIQATFNKLCGGNSKVYEVGDRIAQIIISPYPQVIFVETDNLSDTVRGEGGFGSSGI
jgi:dUTP pyrophosphatase